MAKATSTKADTGTFRVRAVDSVHIFFGDECPALEGKMHRLIPGQDPVEIPAPLAEYFNSFPGLRVDAISVTASEPLKED